MNVIDYIKDFLCNMSVKYRNTDNIYKYQYLYDTHLVEVSPNSLYNNSYYMEDEFKLSMDIMNLYGETILFVSPEDSLHVVEPEFIVSCHDNQVKIEYQDHRTEVIFEEKIDIKTISFLPSTFSIICNKSNTDNMTQQLSSVNDKMQSLNITGTKPNDYKLLNDVELRTILFHEFSYWNLCLLYALKIAYENKQEIILYDNLVNVIGDEKNSAEEKYFFSFLQCLSYFRLAKLDRKGNKYKIISLNQILSNGIEEALDKFKINHPTSDPSIDVETDKHNIYESIVKTN